MADRIQQRRDTAARWSQFNPILLEGEIGYVLDNPNQYKIGDGTSRWNDLPLRGYDGTLSQSLSQSTNSAPSTKLLTDSISSIYKTGNVLGKLAYLINSAISKIIINSERDTTKKYFLTVVRRNNIADGDTAPTSQIEIYSTDADDITSNRQSVARWQTNGDPNENKVSRIKFGTTTKCIVYIDWSKIPDGASYTIMFNGYELSDKCFDTYQYQLELDVSELNQLKVMSQTVYPFKNGSMYDKIISLNKLIVYLYIRDRDENLRYFLSSVFRYAFADGETVATSRLGIYSKDADNNIKGVIVIAENGDSGSDGKLKRYTDVSGKWDIVIDWTSIEIGTKINNMIYSNNIELSNEIFVKQNYDSEIDAIQKSPLFDLKFSLIEGGFINGENGLISTSFNFAHTDFIKVRPGQKIYYRGYIYGNATVCGYQEDKSTFVNLIETPSSVKLVSLVITIPDDIVYIRASTQKINDTFTLVLLPDVNIEFLDDEILRVMNPLILKESINNIIQDPYLKYGIMLTSVNPQLIAFGGGSSLSLSDGMAVVKSTVIIAKGCQIMARFNQGWATQFGLKAGDKIKIGAYIKAKVSEAGVVTSYGTLSRQDIPSSQITYTGNRVTLPVGSINEWQWIERTITLKTDGTDIDQATDLSIGYIQVTDPNANVTPTELYIKQPCILLNPPLGATGFYNSKKSQQIDYLFVNFLSILGDLSMNNINVNGGQLEIESFISESQLSKVRWLQLLDNQCFPSVGTFIGLKNGTDVIVCVNGVETKIN